MPHRIKRLVGLYAMLAAAASLVFAPLLSLAYFATPEGATELETSTVAAWATPVRDVTSGALTFASPGRVYSTYLLIFALLFPAVILSAWAVRRQRSQPPRLERWGWKLALPGYVLLGVGLITVAIMLVPAAPSSPFVNALFLALILPGILLSTIGSTLLGIGLLQSSYRLRLTAWLLALSLPLWIVGSFVLGHNSLGLLPLFIAWGWTGWRVLTPSESYNMPSTAV